MELREQILDYVCENRLSLLRFSKMCNVSHTVLYKIINKAYKPSFLVRCRILKCLGKELPSK